MTTVDLFAIGNALIDQEFKVSDDFLDQQKLQKGTMQLSDEETQRQLYTYLKSTQTDKGQSSGGSAANTTVAFSALGGSAFYGCRVGNDALGSIYLDGLKAAGISITERSISEGVTGTCMVLISPDSERTMQTFLGITTELTEAQIDFTPLKTAQWLYIEGYLSSSPTARQTVLQAKAIARSYGVKVALSLSDPAMVQYAKDGLDAFIGDGIDVLFCNEQEALMFTQHADLEAARQELLQKCQIVVITQGANGALVSTQQNHFHVAGRRVEAVDTNGAGDAFAGAFMYALNQNLSLDRCAQLAILISSEVVSQFGPRLNVAQYAKLLNDFQKECA